MPERSYRWLLWGLALFGFAADQASKYGMFSWLEGVEKNRFSLFRTADGSGFHLTAAFERAADGTIQRTVDGAVIPHVNQGALFGFLRDHKTLANTGFAVVSLLAALAIIWWSTQKSTARDRWLCAALGLILAGTLGNFYDRVVFNGVRDFLHWNYLFDWPVFNLADSCLVVGACLLLIQAFGKQPATESPDVSETSEQNRDVLSLTSSAEVARVP
jgi:lipoprotein signal peptidase